MQLSECRMLNLRPARALSRDQCQHKGSAFAHDGSSFTNGRKFKKEVLDRIMQSPVQTLTGEPSYASGPLADEASGSRVAMGAVG